MKSLKSFFKTFRLFFVLCMVLSGCNAEDFSIRSDADKNALMEKMAMDNNYVGFITALNESSQMIAGQKIDLQAIGELLQANPYIDYCQVDEQTMAAVPNGMDYARIHCEMISNMRAFSKKFPQYRSIFTEEDRAQVRMKSKMMNNIDVTGQEIDRIALEAKGKS